MVPPALPSGAPSSAAPKEKKPRATKPPGTFPRSHLAAFLREINGSTLGSTALLPHLYQTFKDVATQATMKATFAEVAMRAGTRKGVWSIADSAWVSRYLQADPRPWRTADLYGLVSRLKPVCLNQRLWTFSEAEETVELERTPTELVTPRNFAVRDLFGILFPFRPSPDHVDCFFFVGRSSRGILHVTNLGSSRRVRCHTLSYLSHFSC
jgi:hypothetical protein